MSLPVEGCSIAPFYPIAASSGSARRRSFNPMVDLSAGWFIFNRMVERLAPQLDAVFHALGDRTRRRMLRELARGERTVGQLAEPFAISLAAASKHVKALEKAGLIRREVRGRTHLCRLDPGPLAAADRWLRFYERLWTGRLDALEQFLREEDGREEDGAAGAGPGRRTGDEE